jgi:titin
MQAALATAVIAAVGLGNSSAAFADPPTAPDQPTQPTVAQITDTLSVSFDAPADNGSEITGYTVDCTSSDGGIEALNTGVSSPIVVGPLTYLKTYGCTVVASNAYGDSPASDPSDDATIATSAPDTPQQPTADAEGTSITLSMDAPYDNGSLITEYDADCISSDGGVEGTATSDSLPIVVDSLSLGNTYSCTVTATNDQGTSDPSPASDDTVVPAQVPDAPAQPTAVPDDGTITVSFDAPASNGSDISEYDADCISSDGGTEGTGTGTDTTPIVVSSLDNGHAYTCTLTATNGAGTSDPSPASEPVIVGTPTVVGGTVVTVANNAAYVTAGDHFNDAGDDITGYTASCTSSDGGTPNTVTSATAPVYVDGLDNGSTYTCTLFATNSRGDGPIIDESDPFSPTTIPDTPDPPTVTPGDGRAWVSFDAPNDNGDPITSYDVECTSSDGGTTGDATDVTSPIEVDGLDNTNTYSCTVRATNNSGTGLWSNPSDDVVIGPGVPDAPTITEIDRGSNSVTVTFDAPDDHDNAISSYTVTCTSDDGGTTQTASDTQSPIEVDNLTNSSYYTCTVNATNDVGTGPDSDPSDQFLAAAEPDAPIIGHLTRGDNSVTVQLVEPNDNGEAISSYEIDCTSSDGGDEVIVDDTPLTIEVDGLSNGNTYTCNATATNVMGTSVASADSAPFVAGQRPDAPVITSITRGNNSVDVGFDAPWDGSIAIRVYTVSCVSSDGGTTASNRGAGTSIWVNYLTNGHTYECTVTATNDIGDSAASDPSDDFVAAATPRPPSLTTFALGSNAVTIGIRSTADAANPISSYTLTCTSSNGGTTRNNTDVGSPITVGSLSNGKTYTCRAVATNDLGDSAPSPASRAFVASGVPSAPTLTTLKRGSNSASVAFLAGAANGSPITKYTATCTSSDGGTTRTVNGTKSPIAVTLLTNQNTYTCAVTATNAVGTGAASDDSSSFVAAGYANAPVINSVTRQAGGVSVDFATPNDNGSAITSYKATCLSSNGGVARAVSGASSPIVVLALTPGKTYTCTVVAVNGIGTSAASAASSSFVAANVPGMPHITTVTRGSNSVSVPFTVAVANGTPVTGYTVTCTSNNGGDPQSNTGATSPIAVSSLTNGKNYACSVKATNLMGTGASSPGVTFVAGAVPDAPTAVTVTATRGTGTVTFTAPAANGSTITKFTATCVSSDGGTTRTGISTHSPTNVVMMTAGKTYTCTETATNAIGTSAASIASNTFTA